MADDERLVSQDVRVHWRHRMLYVNADDVALWLERLGLQTEADCLRLLQYEPDKT